MDNNHTIKLIKIALLITDNREETTISPRNLQTALTIMYMDNPTLRELISYGTRYATRYYENEKTKFNSFTHYNTIIRDYLGNGEHAKTYRIGGGTIPYLCGVADKLNNQVQQFN